MTFIFLEKLVKEFPEFPRLHGYWRSIPSFNPHVVSSDLGQGLETEASSLLFQMRGVGQTQEHDDSMPTDNNDDMQEGYYFMLDNRQGTLPEALQETPSTLESTVPHASSSSQSLPSTSSQSLPSTSFQSLLLTSLTPSSSHSAFGLQSSLRPANVIPRHLSPSQSGSHASPSPRYSPYSRPSSSSSGSFGGPTLPQSSQMSIPSLVSPVTPLMSNSPHTTPPLQSLPSTQQHIPTT